MCVVYGVKKVMKIDRTGYEIYRIYVDFGEVELRVPYRVNALGKRKRERRREILQKLEFSLVKRGKRRGVEKMDEISSKSRNILRRRQSVAWGEGFSSKMYAAETSWRQSNFNFLFIFFSRTAASDDGAVTLARRKTRTRYFKFKTSRSLFNPYIDKSRKTPNNRNLINFGLTFRL